MLYAFMYYDQINVKEKEQLPRETKDTALASANIKMAWKILQSLWEIIQV